MNIKNYLTQCGNEDFIDLEKCKGYKRLCGPYGVGLEYCDNLLPLIGNQNPKLSLRLANDYFEMLDNTYRDTFIGLVFQKIERKPSTRASPEEINSFNEKKKSFIKEPFSPQFLTYVSAETCNKIYNKLYPKKKPKSYYNIIIHDSMKFGETLFTTERLENLNEIVRKYNEGKDIEDHDREILSEVLGKKRLRNFFSFLEKASKINETKKP